MPAPGMARVARAAVAELADVVDAVARQPPLHLGADARRCRAAAARRARAAGRRRLEHDQPVGLLHVGRELGEQPVGRDADRTGQAFADVGADAGLDPVRERDRRVAVVLVVEQAAGDLVDRADLGDRDVPPDLRDDRVVELDIALVPRGRDDQVAAQALRFPDRRAGA